MPARRRLARGVLARAAAAAAVAALWAWPVDAPHPVVRAFLAPATEFGPGHRGLDIAAPVGAEVRSPADGVVRFSGWVVDRPVVSIDHGGGVLSSFEPVSSPLTAGQPVRRGEVVGVLEAGHCPAGCVHLGARLNGAYVSPLLYLGGQPRAILLPLGEGG